jgi:uncharacterized protein (DUF433 family)
MSEGIAFPGIEASPGVCSGVACIDWTRISTWILERAHRLEMSEAKILHCYPTLRAKNMANAWACSRGY